jgi:hypothetical protein
MSSLCSAHKIFVGYGAKRLAAPVKRASSKPQAKLRLEQCKLRFNDYAFPL